MSKRSIGDGALDFDEICDYKRLPAKRPKVFTHDTEQFPLCSSVGELQLHTLVAQNKKLAERLAQRLKLEEHLRKRIDDQDVRQKRYDAIVTCIHRCWKQLNKDICILLQRCTTDSKADTEQDGVQDGESLLARASRLDEDEFGRLLAAWSLATQGYFRHLLDRLVKQDQDNEAVRELLKQCRDRWASDCNGDLKSDESAKLKEVFSSHDVLLENQKLKHQLNKTQTENRALTTRNAELEDDLERIKEEMEELRNRTEDAEFKVEQWVCREQKYKGRLAELRERLRLTEVAVDSVGGASVTTGEGGPQSSAEVVENGPTDGVKPSSASLAPSVPDISDETSSRVVDEATRNDLAEVRLGEVRALTKQLLSAQETIDSLRFQMNHCSESVIKESALFRGKLFQVHMLIIELNRLAQFSRAARKELIDMSTRHNQLLQSNQETLAKNNEEILKRFQLVEAKYSSAFRNLLEVFDSYQSTYSEPTTAVAVDGLQAAKREPDHGGSNLEEVLKRHQKQLKAEILRWRRKFEEASAQASRLQAKLEQENARIKNSIVIPLNMNGCHETEPETLGREQSGENKEPGELEESDVEDEDMKAKEPTVRICELKKRLLRAKRSCSSLEASLEAFKCVADKSDATDKLKKVLLENGRLRSYIRTACKHRYADVAPELERLNKLHEEEVVLLKRTIEECKKEEQSVLVEAECTGQAYDQALEENTRLQQQVAQSEAAVTRYIMEASRSGAELKAVSDQLDETRSRLKLLEEKLSVEQKKLEVCVEKERLFIEKTTVLQKENEVLSEKVHKQDWIVLNLTSKVLVLRQKADSVEEQCDQLREAQQRKLEMLEEERLHRGRCEEEISLLRKKLDKTRKAVSSGRVMPQDEVLFEENRHLKELLTCPSCKVNRKDATLLKCFHVFCSPCLKKRYESRQRKCPKCAQTFGLNDIKRIFIL